jgi:hypothetical protein
MKDFFPSIYLYLCLYLFCKYNQSIHTYVWFQSLSVKIKNVAPSQITLHSGGL